MDPEVQNRIELLEKGLKELTDKLYPPAPVYTEEELAKQKADQEAKDKIKAEWDEKQKAEEAKRLEAARIEKEEKEKFDAGVKAILKEFLIILGEQADNIVEGIGENPNKGKMDYFVVQAIPRLIRKAKEVNFKPIHYQYVGNYFLQALQVLVGHYEETEKYQANTVFKYKFGKLYTDMTYNDLDVIIKEWAEDMEKKSADQKKIDGDPVVKTPEQVLAEGQKETEEIAKANAEADAKNGVAQTPAPTSTQAANIPNT